MTRAWGDRQQYASARIRSSKGDLKPTHRLSSDLYESDPTALSAGAVAWADRDPGISYVRIAFAHGDGTFSSPRTIARTKDFVDEPPFLELPDGIFVITGRSADPARPPLVLRRVP